MIVLTFFLLLGIFQFSILVHELVHVIHFDDRAFEVCIDWKSPGSNNDSFKLAHTSFSYNKKETEYFETLGKYSEKIAMLAEEATKIFLALLLGISISQTWSAWRKK